MNRKKKIALMLIVTLILQVMLPVFSIVWESKATLKSIATQSGDWEYEINDDESTITITKYKGTEKNLVIPSEIDGYTVTVLGEGKWVDGQHSTYSVFEYGYCIETITLPDTMIRIRKHAFLSCEILKSVELNEGLQTIDYNVFMGCVKLEKLNIPSTVDTIDNQDDHNAFYACIGLMSITVDSENQYYSSIDGVLFNKDKSILIAYPSQKTDEEYIVPESVVQIYELAFNNNTYIKNLSISQHVNNMFPSSSSKYDFAISSCTKLENIDVDSMNEEFSSENGILYNKTKSKLLLYPSGKTDTYYSIPSTVTSRYNIYSISNTYLETIKINSAISNIDFIKNISNLKNIEVNTENTLYSQKDGVLFNKDENQIIYYPSGREDVSYILDDDITNISSKAFENSKLEKITLPTNLTQIDEYAFYNCQNLEDVNLHSNIKLINKYAFYNCSNLKNVTIPNSVTQISEYAFYNCSGLENITIPKDVIEIGDKAFYSCENVKELVFEENSQIIKIGNDAFSECSSLEEVNIPEGITDASGIINKCDNLRVITVPSTATSASFSSTYTKAQIITINNKSDITCSNLCSVPDIGRSIIRCYSTATSVINWAETGWTSIHYNLIDLDENDDKFLYTIKENGEVLIENYIGDEENVEIPEYIEGYPVTELEKIYGTYRNLSIPATVKKIGKIYSSNLENINVDVDNQYFTSKNGILFNKEESQLFSYPMGRQETEYDIPEGTIQIGSSTSVGKYRYTGNGFEGNRYLEKINIPSTVSQIERDALNMENLSEISVDSENKNFITKDNILYKNNNNIEIVCVPQKLQGNVELLYGLTKINTHSFENINNLEAVTISTTVTTISSNAFYYCKNLKKIVIPATANELEEYNAANLIYGRIDRLTIYCEEESTAHEYMKKWGKDYEIMKAEKIEIKQNPEKLTYLQNEEMLNTDGGLISITYDDGTILDLAMNSEVLTITGFNNSIVGQNQIEVDYKGKKANFIVDIIKEVYLTEIKVTTLPNKINYTKGEQFAPEGMVVTATYNDETTNIITDYKVIGGENLNCLVSHVEIQSNENPEIKTMVSIQVEHDMSEATCMEKSKCKVEGCRYTKGNSLGHAFQNYVSNNDATCIEDGTKTSKCERCGEIDTIADEGTALEHDFENYVSNDDATCTEDGTKTAKCERCEETHTVVDVGSALGHNYESKVTLSTCTAQGYTTHTCTRCDDKYVDTYTNALDHDFQNYIANNDATCTEDGTKTAKCERCEETHTITDEGSKSAHNYQEGQCTECGEQEPKVEISSEKYNIENEFISKINSKTTIEDFKKEITTNATEIKIYSKDGVLQTNTTTLATGMRLELKSENETKILKVVVSGDANGDGKADFQDIIAINKHRLKKKLLENEYLMAGEVTGDGKVDFQDIIKVNKFRLKKILGL